MLSILDEGVIAAATNMLESAAVAVLAVLFSFMISERLGRLRVTSSVLIGVAFALMGMAGMTRPVEIIPGIMFDARNVDIALSAFLGGPISAAITTAGVGILRATMGGAGAPPGITAMVMAAIFCSLLWAYIHVDPKARLKYRVIVLGAALTALSPPAATYMLGLDWQIIQKILTYHVPTDFAGVLLLGYLYTREQKRRWANAELAESQARLATVAANVPGVFFQVTRTSRGLHRLTYLSAGSERILGWPAQQLIDNPKSLDRIVGPGVLAEFDEFLESAVKGETQTFDLEIARPDGGSTWMRAGVEPRVNEMGVTVWEGTLFDLTEERRSDTLRNEFVATVSHELRTPLTSIRGSLALAAGGAAGVLPDKAANLIRIAHTNSERLIRLVNDILDIEKIDAGHMQLRMVKTPIRMMVDEALAANASYSLEQKIALRVVDDATGAIVVVDRDRFHQVIDNLLSNALKFSPAETGVEIRLERKGEGVRLSVVDEGPGMSEDFLGRIFGKFEQADSTDTRAKGGSGLGLSIVKGIVERLGGTVGVDSKLGEGATFYLDFPASFPASLADEGHEGGAAADHRRDARSESGLPRILHIDADESLRDMIATALSDDADIVSVGTYAAARSHLRGETFDLVLLDPDLPDRCGERLVGMIDDKTPLLLFAADEAFREKIERADMVAIIKTRSIENDVIELIRYMLQAGIEEPSDTPMRVSA